MKRNSIILILCFPFWFSNVLLGQQTPSAGEVSDADVEALAKRQVDLLGSYLELIAAFKDDPATIEPYQKNAVGLFFSPDSQVEIIPNMTNLENVESQSIEDYVFRYVNGKRKDYSSVRMIWDEDATKLMDQEDQRSDGFTFLIQQKFEADGDEGGYSDLTYKRVLIRMKEEEVAEFDGVRKGVFLKIEGIVAKPEDQLVN